MDRISRQRTLTQEVKAWPKMLEVTDEKEKQEENMHIFHNSEQKFTNDIAISQFSDIVQPICLLNLWKEQLQSEFCESDFYLSRI